MFAARPLLGLVMLLPVACSGTPEPEVQPMPAVDTRPALQRPGPPPPAVASYRIDATLDVETHRIQARQTLTWVNPGRTAVNALPFHLYMNGFKNEGTVFMRESRGKHRSARAADVWGWIEVKTISVDGGPDAAARARFPGPDETVMELPLDRAVAPGGTVVVAMDFEVQLPEVFARTGFKGDFHMVGQWFPKIGVRVEADGQEVWHCEPFHLMSEFFADFGTYDVALTVPDTQVIAATGMLVAAVDKPDATRTLTYHAEAVHDFVWVADPFLEQVSGTARTATGDVEVRVYFRPDQRDFADRHLGAGIGAIEQFSRLLVPYPWPRMTVIDPPLDAVAGAGGMEYPTLVTTAGDDVAAPDGVRLPEFTTIHEVGHNWFQGLLASNEVDEAWLDEGMNSYVDGLVMEILYGVDSGVDVGPFYAGVFELWAALERPYGATPDPVAQRSFEYADYAAYGTTSYGKTAAAMRTLERVVGTERFLAALAGYAQKHAFTHPREADLVAALEAGTGQKLGWFLQPALHELGAAELGVRSIDCRQKRELRGVFGRGSERREVKKSPPADGAPYLCQVLVENLGTVPVPVDVEIAFADGKRIVERWDDRGEGHRWHKFDVEHREPVVEVTIDPDGDVLLDDGGIRRSLRVVPDPAPARRAAARGQFWTQTALQAVGL